MAQLAERWGTRQQSDGKTIWAELALRPAPVPTPAPALATL
ncbi:hypothetical protein ACIOTI_35870 [Streptomyces sp. NPDC087843]